MISIRNLDKEFGGKHVLKNISLDFNQGKVHGIVGENGAGKTTLFRCIAGLESYDGEINPPAAVLKKVLGFLPADPYFLSKITAREYIRLLCMARQVIPAGIDEKNLFNLPLDEYAVNYSTGMKKKLAITAILLQQNNYFIFDEPFNGVDIQGNMIITKLIEQLRSLGKTILISSHIFSTLSGTCDVIYHLKEGMIIGKAGQNEFAELESTLLKITIGDKIRNLDLK